MNLDKAREIVEDLKNQRTAANEQHILLIGAVQGAEAVLKALEEELEEKKPDGKNPNINKRNRVNSKK